MFVKHYASNCVLAPNMAQFIWFIYSIHVLTKLCKQTVDPDKKTGTLANLRTNSENGCTPNSKCKDISFHGIAARLPLF